MRGAGGFTLIELMMTVAVLAVLLTVGVPSFKEFIAKNRISSQTNLLVGALQLARTEAIKRGHEVLVCRARDCTTVTSWNEGWSVQSAEPLDDGSRTYTVIRDYQKPQNLNITSNFGCWIGYGPNGRPVEGHSDCSWQTNLPNGTLTLCPSPPTPLVGGREVIISMTGRIRTEETACPDS